MERKIVWQPKKMLPLRQTREIEGKDVITRSLWKLGARRVRQGGGGGRGGFEVMDNPRDDTCAKTEAKMPPIFCV